jgi:hypothetical protein
MKTVKTIVIVLLILCLVPIASWLIWNIKQSKPINILILNKTVLGLERKEHSAIFWLLLNEKFVKDDNKVYRMEKDYYGFHPNKPLKSRKYEVKRIKLEEINDLLTNYDMAYYSDTYGVFFNEWYRRQSGQGKGTLIEGGLNNNDYLFIKGLHDNGKLLIAEYNFIAPPTIQLVRKKAEELLGIKWTNWTGMYINELDPARSKDLPDRVVGIYKKRNDGEWPFTGSGIVLVNEPAQQVAVLQSDKHLENGVPEIQTTEYGLESYHLPETVHYPYRFDIMDEQSNHVIAEYKIHVNIEGKAVLDEYNLSSRFPAVMESNTSSPFLYLAGDYSDYPVRMWTAKLQGIRTFEKVFYTNKENSTSKFYWTYYVPLLSQVLANYQTSLTK